MESTSGTLVSLGMAMLPMLASIKRWKKKRVEEPAEPAERMEPENAGPPTSD